MKKLGKRLAIVLSSTAIAVTLVLLNSQVVMAGGFIWKWVRPITNW